MSWDDVLMMSVVEFFNIVAYIKERNRRELEDQKQWLAQHRIR